MAMTLITTNTSSNVANSSFTTGIDSTYRLYVFKFYDVNPATDNVHFTFQANASGQSGFNETMTSAPFAAEHGESDSPAALSVESDHDQGGETNYQAIAWELGNGADESCAGELWIYNPNEVPTAMSVLKHWHSRVSVYTSDDRAQDCFVDGIFSAVELDEFDFKMSSGNMDAVIHLYGVG